MASKRRPKVPVSIEAEVLFKSNHICCICRTKGKDVQIHHIDGNKSNNNPANLAVLCLDCHSQVTGRRGLGRSYTPSEIRKYKRSWEQYVQDTRKVHKPQIRYRKELISQIDLIICEILGCRTNNPRSEELLDLLYELHIWRGNQEIDKKIIEGLHHLALMSGLGSPKLASLVADKLWEMCWHFVGPDELPMKKQGLQQILDCISALSLLAKFNCEFGHGRKALDSIMYNAENFLEMGLWYGKKRIVNAILGSYDFALKACYYKGKLEFKYGPPALRRSIRRLKKLLADEQPTWIYQRNKVNSLLKINRA